MSHEQLPVVQSQNIFSKLPKLPQMSNIASPKSTNLTGHSLLTLPSFLKRKPNSTQVFLALLICFHIFTNIYWQHLNTAPPTWDSAGHLALSFVLVDKIQGFFSGTTSILEFLRTSSYYPPLIHVLGSLFIIIFGHSYENVILMSTWFMVLGIIYLYLILSKFFKNNTNLIILTVFIFSFFPQVWEQSRQFHLDIPLTALLLAAFYHLVCSQELKDRKHAFLFFLFFSFAQLTKWYAFVFLIVPFVAHIALPVWKSKDIKNPDRISNILLGSLIVMFVAFPWYIANISSISANVAVSSTADAGDPQEVLSYESLFHYLKLMTSHQIGFISVILLFISIAVIFKKNESYSKYAFLMFLVPYAVFTLIQNKDLRYILPLTPLFAFYIAYLLTLGSSMLQMIKVLLFGMYLLYMYFFLSFNQYKVLEGTPAVFATLIAGPAYKYAWIYDPTYYSYNPNDWKVEEILKRINSEAAQESAITGSYKILELSDNKYYAIADFDLLKVENSFHKMNLLVPYYRFNAFSDDELQDYLSTLSFAIVPENPGNPGLRNIVVLRQLVDYFKSDKNRDFTLIDVYNLPDGNKISLYKRNNLVSLLNPNVLEENAKISLGNILFIDREKIGGTVFNILLTKEDGSTVTVPFLAGSGAQKRVGLDGVVKVKLDLPLNRQNLVELNGWTFKNGEFLKDPTFEESVEASNNEFIYKSFRINPKAKLTAFETLTDVSVLYSPENVKITLANSGKRAYVAYAVTGWQWTNIILTPENREAVVPLQNLIQLEVSQLNMSIMNFPKSWGFFPCYKGDAVCFYPLVEGM